MKEEGKQKVEKARLNIEKKRRKKKMRKKGQRNIEKTATMKEKRVVRAIEKEKEKEQW